MTVSLTRYSDFEDDFSSRIMSFGDSSHVEVIYESWELVNDDDEEDDDDDDWLSIDLV
jgi:hypothetical protein